MIDTTEQLKATANVMDKVYAEIGRGIIGASDMVGLITDAYFAGEPILLEGELGVGKTQAAKNLGLVIAGANFERIQGNDAVMPRDIVGYDIFDQETRKMVFVPGPGLRADILLVDEADRMRSETQAAFLELMGESDGVTVNGKKVLISEHGTFVIATQNPHTFGEGTASLPKPERDRFGVSIGVDKPSSDIFLAGGRARQTARQGSRSNITGTDTMLDSSEISDNSNRNQANIKSVVDLSKISEHREIIDSVYIDDAALIFAANYLVAIRDCAKENSGRMIAPGHRSMISVENIARARVARSGRALVKIDDIADLMLPVVRHRLDVDVEPDRVEAQVLKIHKATLQRVDYKRVA